MTILGEPVATLVLREPTTGVQAILVLDTLHAGSDAGGGVRMMPSVTVGEMPVRPSFPAKRRDP